MAARCSIARAACPDGPGGRTRSSRDYRPLPLASRNFIRSKTEIFHEPTRCDVCWTFCTIATHCNLSQAHSFAWQPVCADCLSIVKEEVINLFKSTTSKVFIAC